MLPEENIMLPSDILEKGWIKFRPRNIAKTRFCTVGAIMQSRLTDEKRLRLAVLEEIRATGWESSVPNRRTIATWNDELGRTQAEVVALVRRAEIACGLRPADDPEQWDIPVQSVEEELRCLAVDEPVLVETV